jgi:rhamnogalacturonan endolyase
LNNTEYTYSAKADAEGKFTIPAVRPGTYTLTAFVDGEFGEYKKENVVVGAHSNIDIGNMVWHSESNGKTLWEIGTPDRSAGEFHIYGGPDGFRKNLTWLEYPYEFPNGVDFKVGESNIKTDWNYFQPAYKTPGTPAELQFRGTTQDHSLTSWKIRFDSKGYSKGTGTLDIALAASVFGTLKVELNGKEIGNFDPIPGPAGDNSSYRLTDRAIYHQLTPITFPAELIKSGENVITLSPTRQPVAPLTAAGTVDNWMEPMAGIMYDYLRMQVKEGQ